ncbi:MAG: hypothetical protein Q9204_005049 [Flavoplaca sp. TL-2023a]
MIARGRRPASSIFYLLEKMRILLESLLLKMSWIGLPTSTNDEHHAIAPAAKLIIIEPCVAIICVCLPTIRPALQDIAAWSTIEYFKMIRRIKDAVAPESSPSVERAKVYTPMAMREDKFDRPIMGLPWASELLEEDSGEISPSSDRLEDIPEKPVMAMGHWSSVG